ncbi:MAG: hypothetical protein J5805_01180 [Bacteroidaceae bacterium]|nr:hypothetical protein [Bacteroidaceae bacterium]
MNLKLLFGIACWCLVLPLSSKTHPKNKSQETSQSRLSEVLAQSSANRSNLEQVLSHYKDDSLKYKAACFLIENMTGCHYLMSPDVQEYYDYLHSVFSAEPEQVNDVYMNAYVKAIHGIHDYPYDCDSIYDLLSVSPEYLIKNIDSAYDMWQKNCHSYSFETFCNYVLPHRIGNEPLSAWRETYISRYGKELDGYFRKQYNYYFPFTACKLLNINFNGAVFYSPKPLPEFPLDKLLRVRIAYCDAYSTRIVAQLRAFGYPSAIDFVPQWGNRSMGHSWSVMFVNDDYTLPFGVNESPGSQFDERSDLTLPKVYRQTYAHQPWLYEISRDHESYVPSLFRSDNYIDVTDKYVETTDVTVPIDMPDASEPVRWAYLAVFDNKTWVPVAFSSVNDGQAVFEKLGRNIVYLPFYMDSSGKNHSANSPFILDREGNVTFLSGDGSDKERILVSRKYKESEILNKYNNQLQHSMFVVSNDRDFKDSVIVATLDAVPENRYYTLPLHYEGKYKYFKFISAKDSHGNIAEVQLFDDSGKLMCPKSVYGGKSGTEGHNFEQVYDGDVLTSYSRIVPDGAWSAAELELPTHLSKIRVHPRSDGNSINAGDKYQLYCWHDGHWHMLGEQVAKYEDALSFDNVPKGVLLLLHNASGGTEERIFTYENGKQVWW